MPNSMESPESASLMKSLGMTLVDGDWKWDKNPLTVGSAGRLPLPLPKDVADMLANKEAAETAKKLAAAAKARQDQQDALDRGFEPPGGFAPSYEEAGCWRLFRTDPHLRTAIAQI